MCAAVIHFVSVGCARGDNDTFPAKLRRVVGVQGLSCFFYFAGEFAGKLKTLLWQLAGRGSRLTSLTYSV